MLCHELERAVHRYLVDVAGYLSNAVDQSPESLSSDEPASAVNIDGQLTLHFYRGEINTDRIYPCVVIQCEGGEEDQYTGNETCQVEVHVLYQTDEATENPTPLESIKAVSDALLNYLRREDLVEQLQRYASDAFTPIGVVPPRGQRRAVQDRTVQHTIILQLYCANTDVLGQSDAEEAALSEALE